jgi:hypothetical protein
MRWITRRQDVMQQFPFSNDQRAHPRLGLDVPIRIHFRKGELIVGRTVDISEAGVSVMVLLEMSIGQQIELDFKLSTEPVNVYAIVKNKNAFRYGLEFVLTDKERTIIKRGCATLLFGQTGSEDAPL